MDGSSAKSKQAAAKARLLKAAGFAVAAALAVAFMKSAAGEVSWVKGRKCWFEDPGEAAWL
jgi:hypothetical protein